MKRIFSALILIGALMLPLLFPLTVSAETTTLRTAVPKQVAVTVTIIGKGTATINGQSVTKQATVPVDRLEDVRVQITPKSTYLLEAVYLDGTDVTDNLINGQLTIEKIQFDTDLAIKFTPKEPGGSVNVPVTGDTSHLYAIMLCWFGSLMMLIILLCGNRKRKQ